MYFDGFGMLNIDGYAQPVRQNMANPGHSSHVMPTQNKSEQQLQAQPSVAL